MAKVKALIINEQSAIMSSQTKVLFLKDLLTRRLSVEWADLFLILDSGILVQSISG